MPSFFETATARRPRNVGMPEITRRGMGTRAQPLPFTHPNVLGEHDQMAQDFFGTAAPPPMTHPPMGPGPGGPMFPQNQGMYDTLERFRAHNAAIAARPPMPSYASRQMALMGNQAPPQQYAGGGATMMPWGAQGNQYAPMGGQPLGMAPTDMGGYMQQMAAQNPGGQFFGGALPTMIAGAGGNRPGFMGPPAAPMPIGPNMANAAMATHAGMYFDPRTGAISPNNNMMSASPHTIRSWMAAGRGPNRPEPNAAQLAANRQNYLGQHDQAMNMRQFNVQQKAYAKGDARARRMGNLSNYEYMQQFLPGFAQADLQHQTSMGWLGGQMGMHAQTLAAEQQKNHFTQMAQLAAAIPQMGLPPGVQQQYMDHIMRQFGMPGQPGPGQMTGTGQQRMNQLLTPKQQGEYRALKTPAEREAWLNANGIMDTATRQFMLGESGRGMGITGQQQPTGILGGISNWFWNGLTGAYELSPFGPPNPTRPSRTPVVGPDGKMRTHPLPRSR